MTDETTLPLDPTPGGRVRVVVWMLHMALPLLALWLLLAQPDLDVRWQHNPSHFWLVLAVAVVNVVLAVQVLAAARLRADARLLLVGYAFMVAAGFLLLHALATPGVVVAGPNGGFQIATPVGLALASVLFALAGPAWSPAIVQRLVDADRVVRWGLVGLMVAWAIVSLAGLPPLAEPLPEQAVGPLRWAAVVSVALYLLAAALLFRAHRARPSVMLVALITAAVLLAESMVTIIWARDWQLSWWLWHILMAAAFGFVAYSAYVQYRREGHAAGLFDGVVTADTASDIREEYGGALETLTGILQRSAQVGSTDEEIDLITAGLRSRFGLSEGQGEVLARAARSLAAERDQARRLGALAQIGTGATVEMDEGVLWDFVEEVVADRFAPDRLRVLEPGEVAVTPSEATDVHTVEVTAGDVSAAVLEFTRPGGRFRPRDVAIMDTLGAEVGIALENVRLYRRIDGLFRTYLSPDVATALRDDPSRSELGGSVVELTALFADLRGFTSFSEQTDPVEVMEMLNRYFGLAVPTILRNGGTVVQFIGDALLAVFDAPTPGPDHAFRAVRSAMSMQAAIESLEGRADDWPRFRVGINTGYALIGNIGSAEFRSFNVVGDAVNTAARFEAAAEPGTVVVGGPTHALVADRVEATSLGHLDLKGKERPMEAWRIDRVID